MGCQFVIRKNENCDQKYLTKSLRTIIKYDQVKDQNGKFFSPNAIHYVRDVN